MALLAYWKWKNYLHDVRPDREYHFSSNQPTLLASLEEGDSLWLMSGRPNSGQRRDYILVARFVISEKSFNPAGYRYGIFRVWGDTARSTHFDPEGPDASAMLLTLEFESNRAISSQERIGQSVQSMRRLTPFDEGIIERFARNLATI